MLNGLKISLICLLVIVPIVLAVLKRLKEATIALTSIMLALVFANLDQLARFSGGGVELVTKEAKQATKEANVATGQLRELALSLTSPIIDVLTLSGDYFHYMPLKYKLERVDKIKEKLAGLGASKAQIDEACSTLYGSLTRGFAQAVVFHLQQANPEKKALFEDFSGWNFDGWNTETLDKLIKDHDLKTDKAVSDALLDLEFWLKNQKLLRPDE